jgi:POT family proton-dependent oligopeptide transporter
MTGATADATGHVGPHPPSAAQGSPGMSRNGHDIAAIGEPRYPHGLIYLAFTEVWERFSYYGMSALLVLYMVQELLLPGHIDQVVGMGAVRAVLERAFGPLSPQALASLIFGLYGGLVYFTPIFGGVIADRWFGAKRTVLLGVLLMTAGHFAMTFEQSFLAALLLLVLGSGCLKGNIAIQVGTLYAADEQSACAAGYTVFTTAANIGATAGPLACGLVAQIWGWPAGFGLAGALMLLALAIYLRGQRHLPDPRPVARDRAASAILSPADRRRVVALIATLMLLVPANVIGLQGFNAFLVWVSGAVDLATPLGAVPVPWFASIDPFAGIVVAPVLVLLWRRQATRGAEPDEIAKIAIGTAIAGLAPVVILAGIALSGGGTVPMIFPLLAGIANGVGLVWYWPAALAIVSRAAPAPVRSMLMGGVYMVVFVASLAAGYVGSRYETMTPIGFWGLHVALAAATIAALLLIGPSLRRVLCDRAGEDTPQRRLPGSDLAPRFDVA